MNNQIIPVYREGKYDTTYMMKLRAKRYLRAKGSEFVGRVDLLFTEYRLTPLDHS